MEEQNYNNDNRDLRITDEGREFLLTASKWARFYAILGFVAMGLGILSSLTYMALGATLVTTEVMPGVSFLGFGAIMLVCYGLYLFPLYCLYRFADRTRKALDGNDQSSLTESLKYQKKMYEFLGIATIVMIGLLLLAIPLMIFFAVAF